MADKTQLLTLAFAAQLPLSQVLGGVLIGALASQAVAVALGATVLLLIPLAWVKLAAGLLFIGFGLWTPRRGGAPVSGEKRFGHPLVAVAVSFFLAEMGDKTQLATAALAAEAQALVAVWLGSWLGMVVANALAAGGGAVLGRRLPDRWVKAGAAILFIVFGLNLIRQALAQR
ncbi:MAG: TMEM165/GDT1 family protein [Candidatus Rokubacteria bacterium]|nr:TMEM165/GDT1 family protein [Candidatus Rokubacteria bacterium]